MVCLELAEELEKRLKDEVLYQWKEMRRVNFNCKELYEIIEKAFHGEGS